jgi:alkylhydroperoxidase family enzyme
MAYAVLVTRNQHRVNRNTIDGLRAHGWTDEQILSATQIIGLFNYYTRMVDALGCDLEDFMQEEK